MTKPAAVVAAASVDGLVALAAAARTDRQTVVP